MNANLYTLKDVAKLIDQPYWRLRQLLSFGQLPKPPFRFGNFHIYDLATIDQVREVFAADESSKMQAKQIKELQATLKATLRELKSKPKV